MKHVPQHDRAWLDKASPTEIAAATAAGELREVLAGNDPPPIEIQIELDRIVELHPPAPTPGQGANADSASADIGSHSWREAERAKLRAMSPAEVNAAYARGDLDALLNINPERNPA